MVLPLILWFVNIFRILYIVYLARLFLLRINKSDDDDDDKRWILGGGGGAGEEEVHKVYYGPTSKLSTKNLPSPRIRLRQRLSHHAF